MNEGKVIDVVIEHNDYYHPQTGILVKSWILDVWADGGLEEFIKKVDGVYDVTWSRGKYMVCVDHRYNLDWVEKEIEATIKINQNI